MKLSHQKLKLLYLMKILLEKTDEEHTLTVPEMISELAKLGISAERRSIYDDIEYLKLFGIDICTKKSKTTDYFVASRDFELPELKLLVDSVQSSKFITRKKSLELISKIEKLTSEANAKKLQRQVFVTNRVKTLNERIYYNVDKIHDAIAENKQITFKYFYRDVDKKQVYRKNGELYKESPVALTWDDENYYLIGYDSDAEQIRHYRVDKMLRIQMSKEDREGREHFKKLDMADYARKSFGMFRGEEQQVKLLVNNRMAGVIIDRFGKEVMMIPADADHFRVSVEVHVSPQFLSWIISLGDDVKIIGPEDVVERMREEIRQYGE